MSLVAVLILLAAHTAPATAQQKAQTVSGTVLDPDGNPLIGATVVVVKGTQGAVTDVKGKFTIKAKPSDSLQISYLGYKTETLNVGSRTKLHRQDGEGLLHRHRRNRGHRLRPGSPKRT